MVIEKQCPVRCNPKKSKLHVSINPVVVECSCSNIWRLPKSKSDLRLNEFTGNICYLQIYNKSRDEIFVFLLGRPKGPVNPRIFDRDVPKSTSQTTENKSRCKSNDSGTNKSIQTKPIAASKSKFVLQMQQNNSGKLIQQLPAINWFYLDSNCSLIVNLPNQQFVRKSCYYFEPQKQLDNMKTYRCKIRSNGEPHGMMNDKSCNCCDRARCSAWTNRIMQGDGSDTSSIFGGLF